MLRIAALVCSLAAVAHADAPAGVVSGTVIYEGNEPPEMQKQARDTDPKCPQNVLDDSIVVTHGKLKDVLVRIQNGAMGEHKPPSTPVVLDQKGCSYAPRVVGIVAGQKLVVRNSDNTFHNVWGVLAGKELFNKPQAPGAAPLELDPSKAKPGDVVEIKCGVHAWMHAYAVVQDHPFFAVTDDKGAFKIEGLPQGKYTLEAWHPTLGTKTMQIEIGRGGRAKVKAQISYNTGR